MPGLFHCADLQRFLLGQTAGPGQLLADGLAVAMESVVGRDLGLLGNAKPPLPPVDRCPNALLPVQLEPSQGGDLVCDCRDPRLISHHLVTVATH